MVSEKSKTSSNFFLITSRGNKQIVILQNKKPLLHNVIRNGLFVIPIEYGNVRISLAVISLAKQSAKS